MFIRMDAKSYDSRLIGNPCFMVYSDGAKSGSTACSRLWVPVLSWGPFNDQWFQITFPWTRETGNTWTAGFMALHKLGESTQIWQTITMTTSQSKIKACEKIGPIQMKPKFANCMSELWTRLCTKQIVALTYKNGELSHISTSSEEAHIW